MYILPKQTRTVTCYMTDLSSCHGGCPATNKITTVLTTAKTWSWVSEGLSAKTGWLSDWLTDQLTVNSCKVTLTLFNHFAFNIEAARFSKTSANQPITTQWHHPRTETSLDTSSGWRWRQQCPPKQWYPTATLCRITIQETKTWIFTGKISYFTSILAKTCHENLKTSYHIFAAHSWLKLCFWSFWHWFMEVFSLDTVHGMG